MKKAISLLLLAALTAGLLIGCGAKSVNSAFTPRNDIITYRRIDPDKTQITVSRLGNNANIEALAKAFEQTNPDVQVVCLDLTGGTTTFRPVLEWVTNGCAPDVMFVNSDTFPDDEMVIKYFEDFSTYPVIENFEAEALYRLAVQGFVYFLPAPSEINCIIYNKTLFEQYGWEVPKTFDAFVALCLQIKEDTGGAIQPWNPNAKYDNVFSTALEAFAYAQVLGGVENRGWYNDFCVGKATFKGHMEPFFDMIQTLIDNGILTEEHFSYSATTRGKEFQAGTLAMSNAPVSRMTSKEFEFGYMPYPPTAGEAGYVNDTVSSLLCMPKKTHTDKEKDAISQFINFYGSVDGQQALIGTTLMVSNVKEVPLNESAAMAGVSDVIAQGNKFSRMDFLASGELSGGKTWSFRDCALSMVRGEKTGAELIAQIDQTPYETAAQGETAVRLAQAAEDFTVFEFSCYIADMYREKADADIGLINHGIAYRGNLVRVFKGDLYDTYLYPFLPRSFANNSTLVKLSMTGAQLVEALNHPVGNDTVSDSVYAFSGLKCELAPWNELGKKVLSVKLADGSAIDPDRLYTVAAWEGTIGEAYITETLQAYEGKWETLMGEKLSSDGVIAPAKDERVKLVWD